MHEIGPQCGFLGCRCDRDNFAIVKLRIATAHLPLSHARPDGASGFQVRFLYLGSGLWVTRTRRVRFVWGKMAGRPPRYPPQQGLQEFSSGFILRPSPPFLLKGFVPAIAAGFLLPAFQGAV